METNTTHPTTCDDWADRLEVEFPDASIEQGSEGRWTSFDSDASGDIDRVRLVVDRDAEVLRLYGFDGYVVAWQAQFDLSTPVDIVVAAAKAAAR
jgi:hypothetical protein